MLNIRTATNEDIMQVVGEPVNDDMIAYAVYENDTVYAVTGVTFSHDFPVFFNNVIPNHGRHPVEIFRTACWVVQDIVNRGIECYTTTKCDQRFLQRLGFFPLRDEHNNNVQCDKGNDILVLRR